MNFIELILSKFSRPKPEVKISEEDVEFVINERLNEKKHLERILKTLRWQASSQLEEIKKQNQLLSNYNAEKDSLLKQLEFLKLDLVQLSETYADENEKLISLISRLDNLEPEKSKITELNNHIKILELELERIKQNILKENEELTKLKSEKLILVKHKIKIHPAKEIKKRNSEAKREKAVRCKGKTESNHRCKIYTKNKTGCCHFHQEIFVPKRKMKLVNFNA